MSCTDQQKAVVFLTALPIGLAAEVASHLTAFSLRQLSETAAVLPEVDTQTRASILREMQSGVTTPMATLAQERPFEVARRLENKWLGGSKLRLELGAGLLEAVQGGGSRYSYLRSLRSKAVWWHIDGPHCNDELPDNGFQFLEDGKSVEQGSLDIDRYYLLDSDGPHQYGGCRYRECKEGEISPQDSWCGVGLNPADILGWHSRVLSDRQARALPPAPASAVSQFLELAREKASRKSLNMEWARAAECTIDWGEPSLALLLTESTVPMGYYRAALLFCCLQLYSDHRRAIFEKLTTKESRGILRALTRIEEGRCNFEVLQIQLSLLLGPIRDLSEVVAAVVQGRPLPIPTANWQAVILRALDDRERSTILEGVLDRLTENGQKELMTAYSALALRRHFSILTANSLIAEMMEPSPTNEIECQRLVIKNPVEAALAFKRLITGSWAETRLREWARSDPEKACDRIANSKPGTILTESQTTSALFGRLGPAAGELLQSYLTALGVTLTKDETNSEKHGPRVLAVYTSLLKEHQDDGGQPQISGS